SFWFPAIPARSSAKNQPGWILRHRLAPVFWSYVIEPSQQQSTEDVLNVVFILNQDRCSAFAASTKIQGDTGERISQLYQLGGCTADICFPLLPWVPSVLICSELG